MFALIGLFGYSLLSVSEAGWTLDSVKDGYCSTKIEPWNDIDEDWICTAEPEGGGWYIPMSSCLQAYKMMAAVANKEEDVASKLCLRIRGLGFENITFTSGGYTDVFFAKLESKGYKTTYAVHSSTAEGKVFDQNGHLFQVLTDNESFVLEVKCPGAKKDGWKRWMLYATGKTINEETTKIVLDKVKSLGFDTNKTCYYNYDDCR